MRLLQAHVGLGVLALLAASIGTLQTNFAQSDPRSTPTNENNNPAKLAANETTRGGESISFQLRDWKQMHFHDASAAEKHLKVVEQLGCVAKKSQHGGHIDVRYHCQEWKSISLDNPESAREWHDWLVSSGFDVFWPRVDAEFSSGTVAVQFRLEEFKTLHDDASNKQTQFVETLKKIGCDVRVADHDGHSDIRFRAPIWCTMRVTDEAAANQWRQWLTEQGFEAKVGNSNL